ncbi:MAG: flagellar biosynthesis protein FlhF [Pirellulales bacterium]
MDIKTYRAKSMNDALNLVRQELGPDAAVLHTREVRAPGVLRWLTGSSRQIEVTASASVNVPSRLPERMRTSQQQSPRPQAAPVHLEQDYRAKFRDDLRGQLDNLQSMVEDLCRRTASSPQHDLPEALFHIFTDLIEADVSEELARDWIGRASRDVRPADLNDTMLVKSQISRMIESEIQTTGPITLTEGKRKLVALVGPTGVGKTTTIAKLAANYRLREKRRVGLITVDTYRIAAVEQLRTYADIIDLPMEVVSTPREMREAVARLSGLDLVLMDTAGRSPRDEVKIQELRAMLNEARPDEVHLVLSAVSGGKNLAATARKFSDTGTTALLLTKLDEAAGLGNLLPLLRECPLPLSYLTAGQNVPDDIQIADSRWIATTILGAKG